ncbi:MAG: IPTL-CTERM sorting domain-containing protein [Candidatus Latescibacteria bacterium]|nr:IPTL-CTERM sorting domain-containing protein [Candidatus Latescibacterota bacterium]NIO28376.1 IPTL-CTERM sorting domain-containing protein [Candidatus Latescibacterota bacterium]NIO55925.1 IPTL-CTERM sorting domain-containing protein [Candidatus Latescibacterota bacterium]NIT01889.1 IPTL-CTERM sorting domain-containing protein [Candidatus Latescibacterota bacterium]
MVPSGNFTDLTQITIWIYHGAFDNIVLVPALDIPTVSQWGLIVLVLLLVTAGTLLIIRRRQAKTA